MQNSKQAINDFHHWLIFDEINNPYLSKTNPAQSALAFEDAFIRWLPQLNTTQEKAQAILHLYPLQAPTILLGAKDKRLPCFEEAVHFLQDAGYQTFMRSHGGLAVVNDPGVTNFALVTDNECYPLSIEEAYQQLVNLVTQVLQPFGLNVEAYEIEDSYCPGSYDLVIEGRKIGGIAQRRYKSGVTTAAYISVTGNQTQRAQLIHHFYQIGQADDSYPHVNPNVMASLSEFLNEELSVTTFHQLLTKQLKDVQLVDRAEYQTPELATHYLKMIDTHTNRNQIIL